MVDADPPMFLVLASPHAKANLAKGRINTSDEPAERTLPDPSIPPTTPKPAGSTSALGSLLSWASMITGSKPAAPVPVSTNQDPNGEASPERLSMLPPTKQRETETVLVPIYSSSSETLSPDAGKHESISTVESPPSSNGIIEPAAQDSTHPSPSFASIAGRATATASSLPAGGGKLTTDAPVFVPRRAVVIKNTSGEEVDLRKLGASTSPTATTGSGTTTPIPALVPKATDKEEEKKRKRLFAVEVRKRAEEEARKKREEEETIAIAKAKTEQEYERAKRGAEADKVEEEAKQQAEADAEKEALMRRIQEQEAELALLKAKLAAQSQALRVQPVAAPPLQASGESAEDQEHDHHGQVMSPTDDTGSVMYSENAVQHDEEEESQREKEQEKYQDWSADHPHESELSYFPITPGPLTAPPGTFSTQQQQQQAPGQPLQKMGRERSRRGGRRDRNRAAHADKGEKGDEATNLLNMHKSRSYEPRKRAAPNQLDLSTMQRSRTLHPALPSALSSAKNITDITIVVYPAGVRTPKPELNAWSRNGPFRCAILSLSDSVVCTRQLIIILL
jgi:hypothetical protein